jgi:hypothetical protein
MLDSTKNYLDFMNTIITGDQSWAYGYDPETKSFRHFPYNENQTRVLTLLHSNAACHKLTLLTSEKKFTDAYEG